MQERKNHLSALAGSAILFLLLTAAFNLANAAPPAQKVNVVNTPNVTVANPSTNAVAVRGADNPGFQPFHALRVGCLNAGQPGQIIDLMAVPAGKRAVIETFTVNTQLPSGQKPQIMIITTTSETSVNHWVTLTPQTPEPLGSKPKPDRERREHPVPTEPVDPRTHPNRRMTRVPLQAHPA